MKNTLFSILLLYSSYSIAGGTDYKIQLSSFSQTSKTNYVLVLKPIKSINYSEAFLNNCDTFTVKGIFNKKRAGSMQEEYLEYHLEAINYLKNNIMKEIRFGSMGRGYKRINKNEPCIVKSNFLEFATDGRISAVLSHY